MEQLEKNDLGIVWMKCYPDNKASLTNISSTSIAL